MSKKAQVQDRRRRERWSTAGYGATSHIVRAGIFKSYDKNTGEFTGHLIDVSVDGLKVTGEQPVERGTRRRIHIDIPEPIMGQSTMEFDVQCVWCMFDDETQSYLVGYAITSIDELPERIIDSLIEANAD